MTASQKLEFNIMCVVPFAIILYMKATFGEFLDALYGSAAGVCVMTACLCIYAGRRTGWAGGSSGSRYRKETGGR